MSETAVLSCNDLAFLLKAVQCYASKPSNQALMDALIGSQLARSAEEAKERFNEAKEQMDSPSTANHKERCTLLEAKLIQMRDSATADKFCRETKVQPHD